MKTTAKQKRKTPQRPVSPRSVRAIAAELRKLSGFGFGTGGGRRVIRKPILEDWQ